ncbi:hypothetical protein [Salinibius halmophilus]|uniref:hypothetical protein n=1 Tax=Salinibius halmophilus TaxID=1853216 RepID=UPI000E675FFD|nr:hypothetical protein [Salinibius halmophilus]
MSTELDLQRMARELAIESNHSFWQLAENDITDQQKRDLLSSALASVYLWTEAGNEENKYLAYMAAARAFAINEVSSLAKEYACKAYAYFKDSDQLWIRAFSNAILSHALLLTGQSEMAETYYQEAVQLSLSLSEQEKIIFSSTLAKIPNPAVAA